MRPYEYYDLVRSIAKAKGSKFFTVEFVKKDGTLRTMLVQYAATATHTKGEDAAPSRQRAAATRRRNHPELLNVYDVDRRAIRSINMDTLLRIDNIEVQRSAA